MTTMEVAIRHVRDVAGALAGGADRLVLGAGEAGDRVPEAVDVSAVLHAVRGEVPVRVHLRDVDALAAGAADVVRLAERARDLLDLGAEGVCFGFLDADLEVDVDATLALAAAIDGAPWTFGGGGAADHSLDLRRTWSRLRGLAGLTALDAVATAGSPQGVGQGIDDLLRLAVHREVAALLMPAGGLQPEHVPWLAGAGVRRWHLDDDLTRPGGSRRAYVDADHVRAWRLLLDDATARAAARTPHTA